MYDFDAFDSQVEDPSVMAFRDILFLMVFSLVVVIFLLTFLINPVPKPDDVPLRTQILIEATWPSGTGYDVDLWGMGPDAVPVGWGIYATIAARSTTPRRSITSGCRSAHPTRANTSSTSICTTNTRNRCRCR